MRASRRASAQNTRNAGERPIHGIEGTRRRQIGPSSRFLVLNHASLLVVLFRRGGELHPKKCIHWIRRDWRRAVFSAGSAAEKASELRVAEYLVVDLVSKARPERVDYCSHLASPSYPSMLEPFVPRGLSAITTWRTLVKTLNRT